MITHMIHCLRVTARLRTVRKMPYQLVVISTQLMALILLTHLVTGLMVEVMLRFALSCYLTSTESTPWIFASAHY